MPGTTNYNLYKPVAGESGWADEININFDVIDAQMMSNQNSITGHTGTGSNKHEASQIRTTDGSSVQTALNGKADAAHSHAAYALQSGLEAVESTLDLLAPDLTLVNLFVEVVNRGGGIRIHFYTDTGIYFTQAVIQVEKDGAEVANIVTSSSVVFIPGSDLSGIEDADVLSIKVILYSGLSSKERTVHHTFHTTTLPLEERLNAIETQLTLGNIIDSFAQDEDALQALANVLHSSNTLAQKVSELMQQ
ncbi:MAG: hypothetical protein K8R90_10285 [Candidatus Cloacimonetes bacterium]|nr:hypothetical protein [Candidatus Cloacimonadota bacterium]